MTRRQVAYFSIAGAMAALGAGFNWASDSEVARQVVVLTAAGIPQARVCNIQPGTPLPVGQVVVSALYEQNQVVGWFDVAGDLVLRPPRHAPVNALEFAVATTCASEVAWLGALIFFGLAIIVRPLAESQPGGFQVLGRSKERETGTRCAKQGRERL